VSDSPKPKSTGTSPESEAKRASRSGVVRFSTVELLVALILLFVSAPFFDEFPGGHLLEAILMTLVLVAAVLAVGGRQRTLLIAALLVLPALVFRWTNHLNPSQFAQEAYLCATLVFMLFIVANLFRFILRAPRVNIEVLCAAIAGYLLLGLLWAFAYRILARIVPGSFLENGKATAITLDQLSFFYFSFVTLTTTGYGDFIPVSQSARMLAVMEAMTGTFYVAVLISRLVALYSRNPPPSADSSETP